MIVADQQSELEQERQQYALDVLERVVAHKATPADILFLAHELGVSKQFIKEGRVLVG